MRQELGLVGSHVGVRRAIAAAALAREAPVERLFDLAARPAVRDHLMAIEPYGMANCATASQPSQNNPQASLLGPCHRRLEMVTPVPCNQE